MSGSAIWQNMVAAVRRSFGAVGRVLPWRGTMRLLLTLALTIYFLFAAAILVLRYQVLPDIARYQPDIEQVASAALGLPVQIGSLSAGWEGLRPELFLDNVRVMDGQGREALFFRRVEAVLSWRSVALLDIRLHRLLAEGPTVHAERRRNGQIFIAGIQAYPSAHQDSEQADWLLRQDEITVTDARVVWRDETLVAPGAEVPALTLDEVDFRLENSRRSHRFALLASPPKALSGRLDLRGDLRGQSFKRLAEWQGQMYLSTPKVDLAAWRQWIAAPIKLSEGHGGLRMWGKVDGFGVTEVTADLALSDLRLTLEERIADGAQTLPELDMTRFEGRLMVQRGERQQHDTYHVSGLDLGLQLRDGLVIPPTSFHLKWTPVAAQGGGSEGLAVVTRLDLGGFVKLASYLPLDRNTRETLQRYAPEGELKNVNFTWRGNAEHLQRYTVGLDFANLGMQASGLLPGFDGLSGRLSADEASGQLEIASVPLALEFPAVFPQPRIALDELNAKLGWTIKSEVLEVNLQQASFAGPDADGSAHGSYRLALSDKAPANVQAPGEIDLAVKLSNVDATAVWRYLPHLIGADVRHWVRDAVRGGKVREAEAVLKGSLAHFPFPKNAQGQFLVKARVNEGRLIYAPDWPEISELETDLRFEGSGVSFDALQSSIAGVKLGKVHAAIADFAAPSPLLTVAGEAHAPMGDFIRFLEQSPLGEMLGRFYQTIRLSGDGKLQLGLEIPLDKPETTRVKGDFDIAGGTANVDPLLPPITGFGGRVSFTDSSAQASNLSGQFFGRPVRVDLRAQGKEVRVAAFGAVPVTELQRQFHSPLLAALSGSMPWQAAVSVRDGQVGFAVESSLEGLQSALPEPFAKSAESVLPVRFTRMPLKDTSTKPGKARAVKTAPEPLRDQLRLEVSNLAGATLIRRLDGAKAVIERGIAAVDENWAALPVPDKGLRVLVSQPSIDLDRWRAALNAPAGGPVAEPAPTDGIDWPTPQFDLRAKSLKLFSRQWRDVSVSAMPISGGVSGRIDTRDMSGDWSWESAGKGSLRARLKQLVLPDATAAAQTNAGNGGNGAAAPSATGSAADDAPDDLPALDIVAEQLLLGQRRLGRLEVLAENSGGSWRVPRFQLSSPDGSIGGKGFWTPATAPKGPLTSVDLAVEANDLGKLLARFGYPDAVRHGQGTLTGQLTWRGAPTAFHAPTLNGRLELRVERGQFNKLEPGIGKLLSLLSLQMLPRRIVLDFRDVFSEGFAFEKIHGDVAVSKGVFASDNLVIEGPAAKVLMVGNADLPNDRVNVQVAVQPELGSTVALGAAMAVNPVVGVATLLAQKLFRDPLNKAFAFEYEVTGSLSDPQINKVGGPSPEAMPGPALQPPKTGLPVPASVGK